MAEVVWTAENVMKCICGQCPVQAESACVAEKNAKTSAAVEAGMEGMPAGEDVAGLYCSGGVAACDDLDFGKNCICLGCEVYKMNGLDQWKYCERGTAADIG